MREGRNTGQALVQLVTNRGERFDRERLIEVLTEFPEVRSIHWSVNSGVSEITTGLPTELLWGEDAIEEEIDGLRFRVRPNAFLQTNTAMAERDSADPLPSTVRRAVAFMELNLDQAITIGDIAAAAGVTVRAVQTAFQRHVGATPLGELRRLRLAEVRSELLAADPAERTVAEIAVRWGFHHHGRMAAAYLEQYGELPSTTLAS